MAKEWKIVESTRTYAKFFVYCNEEQVTRAETYFGARLTVFRRVHFPKKPKVYRVRWQKKYD